MRMVNISNEKSMQSYTARCSRYKNKYTNLVCGKTAVGRNYNLPRDIRALSGQYEIPEWQICGCGLDDEKAVYQRRSFR